MRDAGTEAFLEELEPLMADAAGPRYEEVLERVLARLDCRVGTIHGLDGEGAWLVLRAQKGVPPPVLDKVQRIPIGKGMAGLAAERREPVQVCNLQEDESVVRPGAKQTGAEGSIACPMLDAAGELAGVLGVAKHEAYDFREDEIELLMRIGRELAARA